MSLSASAENLTNDNQSCDGGSMCLELALEGERLCKAGDCRAGVAFFLAAIQARTDDLRTLSAIYSQLGNAYFYLGDYSKAMKYHKHDLTIARSMGDKLGEAKSSGNLGNTLKVMGMFNEAVTCCKRHLEISRELGDRLSEGRALYNLGNVYHAQGKQLGRVGQNDPGQFPQEVRDCLDQALSYYEQNLALMSELGDKQACGRACGNLGNTCYLLGKFSQAIKYHTDRLQIAQQFGDKAAERRANSNLGNSHIFLGQFENAAEHYKRTLLLAQELGDVAVEAQACYSLGNTYTLLREFAVAVQYHVRHLAAAQQLGDRVGEGRASWSLGNAHAALGNHEKALYFADKHYEISKELGDNLGVATAQLNMCDLRKVLGLPPLDSPEGEIPEDRVSINNSTTCDTMMTSRVRRQSMEQLSLLQLTPDAKSAHGEHMVNNNFGKKLTQGLSEDGPAESFFDLLSRCQSQRMNDQRATLSQVGKENHHNKLAMKQTKLQRSASNDNKHNISTNSEAMLEMILDLQSERIDSQRASLYPSKKPAPPAPSPQKPKQTKEKPDDEFLDILARVQGSRLEDQRSELPRPSATAQNRGVTVPDEDFFSLIVRVQGGRMEDQRATVPLQENRLNQSKRRKAKINMLAFNILTVTVAIQVFKWRLIY